MSNLVGHLDAILSYLKLWDIATPKCIQPGVSREAIHLAFQSVDLVPTEELLTYYEWADGVSFDGVKLGQIHFIPGFHLYSLEYAIAHIKANQGDSRWSASWFPFMANGGGDFYIADLSTDSTLTSPVINFMLDDVPDVDIEYTSIELMFQTFKESFESGVVFPEDGSLNMDDDKHAVIANRLNPLVEYWKTVV